MTKGKKQSMEGKESRQIEGKQEETWQPVCCCSQHLRPSIPKWIFWGGKAFFLLLWCLPPRWKSQDGWPCMSGYAKRLLKIFQKWGWNTWQERAEKLGQTQWDRLHPWKRHSAVPQQGDSQDGCLIQEDTDMRTKQVTRPHACCVGFLLWKVPRRKIRQRKSWTRGNLENYGTIITIIIITEHMPGESPNRHFQRITQESQK